VTGETAGSIKFYGAMWCGDTRRARAWFDDHHVPYEWIDIEVDPAAEAIVKSLNRGNRSIPTIVFGDGSRLVEPSAGTLEEHARKLGLVDTPPAR